MSKIPANAKMVFKGVIFDVWQWDQEMFDGSFETFEMLKRPNTVRVIATTGEGTIMVLDQEQPGKPPYMSLPAGRVEANEEPSKAAKRELLEETGFVSDNWVLWNEESPSGKIDWTIFTFIAKDCHKIQEQNLDHGEKIEVNHVTFDEFLNLTNNPLFYEKDLFAELVRANYDTAKYEELHNLLFTKSVTQ